MSSSIHHGRGSEAKGMHFYQTIQLRELQDHELMIPRNFVERYWKDVSNPISLRLPNESVCKLFWVQYGDDIWLQNWERFARSLRCGDLIVFQYRGGSEFHVIILDDSKLEIDYSSIRCDEQEVEESDDMNDNEVAKQPLKKKKINSNDSATTAATPHGTNIDKRKIHMNVTQKKSLESNRNRGGNNSHPGENPNFILKLPRTYVDGEGLRLRIPNQFSKEYMNELLQGNATITSVGEDRTWHVKLCYDEHNRHFTMRRGWKSFAQEHNLQVGDVCKFEMTQREPLSFTITIVRATKEPCPDPEQFQGCGHAENQQVQVKSETSPVENMDYLGNYGEGTSRSCPKTQGSSSRGGVSKKATRCTRGVTNVAGTSQRRESDSKDSIAMNRKEFKIVVSSVYPHVPNNVLSSHGDCHGKFSELKVDGKSWFVKLYCDRSGNRFYKGWKKFKEDLRLEIGDTCFLKLIDEKKLVFEVSFKRKNQ